MIPARLAGLYSVYVLCCTRVQVRLYADSVLLRFNRFTRMRTCTYRVYKYNALNYYFHLYH